MRADLTQMIAAGGGCVLVVVGVYAGGEVLISYALGRPILSNLRYLPSSHHYSVRLIRVLVELVGVVVQSLSNWQAPGSGPLPPFR